MQTTCMVQVMQSQLLPLKCYISKILNHTGEKMENVAKDKAIPIDRKEMAEGAMIIKIMRKTAEFEQIKAKSFIKDPLAAAAVIHLSTIRDIRNFYKAYISEMETIAESSSRPPEQLAKENIRNALNQYGVVGEVNNAWRSVMTGNTTPSDLDKSINPRGILFVFLRGKQTGSPEPSFIT